MRRTEIEKKLKSLGWVKAGVSGERHDAWTNPGKAHTIYVRRDDLINNATAERLLDEAER